MTSFVLIHGAWHGAWCWNKVIPSLQDRGHYVVAPDLPGHGNNPCVPASISLQSYTDYISEIVMQQREPVILVGHSMAGIVISQVAERMPDRIMKLVYLTAFMLDDGQTLLEVTQKDRDGLVLPNLVYSRDRLFATVRETILENAFYNECDPEDVSFAGARIVPEPLAPLSTPVHVTSERWGSVPSVYIECTRDRAISLSIQRQMHRNMHCRPVYSMETGHSPFFSSVNDLTAILDQLSGPNQETE